MLPAPRLTLSSRIAAGILVTIVVSTIVAIAVPQLLPRVVKDVICGAGFILGLPLFVLLINDLANLRRERTLREHATLSPAVPEAQLPEAIERAVAGTLQDEDDYEDEDDVDDADAAPTQRIRFDFDGIASAQLRRWQGWRPWLLLIAALTVATKIAFGPWWMVLGFYVLAPAVLRELYLAINALETMTPAIWSRVPPWERAWARWYPALFGLAVGAALLLLVGLLVREAVQTTWSAARVVEALGASVMSSLLVLMLAGATWKMLRLAWREPPVPDDEDIPAGLM